MAILTTMLHDDLLQGIVALAVLCGIVDVIVGIVAALADHTFTLAKIADFLETHVLFRVLPITGAALLAAGTSAIMGVMKSPPPGLDVIVGGLYSAAVLGVVGYIGETAKSLTDRLPRDKPLLP